MAKIVGLSCGGVIAVDSSPTKTEISKTIGNKFQKGTCTMDCADKTI